MASLMDSDGKGGNARQRGIVKGRQAREAGLEEDVLTVGSMQWKVEEGLGRKELREEGDESWNVMEGKKLGMVEWTKKK